MNLIADLHLHSKYSRATSKFLDIQNLEKWARIKGLNLLGTSDFTHPKWIKEIKKNLTDDGTGILKTKTGMPFVMQTEVSLIYTDREKGRRVHNVILAPNIEIAEQVTEYFLSKGRIDYDGRPIFKIPCVDLAESLMEISKKIEIIPAHCLTSDSLIHTKDNLKQIKDITKKDEVLTHKGRFKKVKKTLKRKYSGEIIEIIPSCLKKGTTFTPEHPIYSIKTYKSCKNVPHTICKPTCAYLKRGCKIKAFEDYAPSWNQIKDLKKGDVILYPRFNKIKNRNFLYLNKLTKGFKEGDYIKPRKSKQFIKNIPIKNKIRISEEFCRLIGYYLAEGYISKDHIGFTFSERETEYINDVISILKKVFGKFINIQTKKENSKGLSIIVYSKILKGFFSIFYAKSPFRSFNKCIPQWFIELPIRKLKEILLGWWRGDAGYTSSFHLINQFKTILIKMGTIPSINTVSANSVNKRRKVKNNRIGNRDICAKHDMYCIHNISFFTEINNTLDKIPEFTRFITKLNRRKGWMDKNYIYLPINKINKKRYSGLVYNLEVEQDNSYLTENLAVHNCWTPWFGLLGENSHYTSVEDAFKDKTKHIHAVETGLSSDPPMNWRLSSLDKFALISNSDSHSFWPWRIGREATTFDLKKLTYNNLIKALRTKEGLTGTIEVDPAYGKYHWDGHRNCNVCLSPKQTRKAKGICPKCGKPVTIGVENRVEELADRPEGFIPKGAKEFKRLIPISEIISKLLGKGVATKTVWTEFNKLQKAFKTEYNILLDVPEKEIAKVTNTKIAKAIIQNRKGKIKVQPGYDGEYGVPLFPNKL